jgi:pimeloyl-ACP methyl ester carboxylesterase
MTTPDRTGYADVNGLHLYHEVYGDGVPLVLLHGGMMTIDFSFGTLIPWLAGRFLVIAAEAQGHGRTADTDRPITPANSASDVVALLDHLGVDRAHVLGHSSGGATTMELAVNHPDRVRSIVPMSISVRPEGMHPDFSDPARMAVSDRMPTPDDFAAMTEAYRRLSPHRGHPAGRPAGADAGRLSRVRRTRTSPGRGRGSRPAGGRRARAR